MPIDPGYFTEQFDENSGPIRHLPCRHAQEHLDAQGTPVEVTVYRWEIFFAARNNEFGHANYEIIKAPAFMDPANQ